MKEERDGNDVFTLATAYTGTQEVATMTLVKTDGNFPNTFNVSSSFGSGRVTNNIYRLAWCGPGKPAACDGSTKRVTISGLPAGSYRLFCDVQSSTFVCTGDPSCAQQSTLWCNSLTPHCSTYDYRSFTKVIPTTTGTMTPTAVPTIPSPTPSGGQPTVPPPTVPQPTVPQPTATPTERVGCMGRCPAGTARAGMVKILGDANCDGIIDQIDYAAWLGDYVSWFNTPVAAPGGGNWVSDFNCDGVPDLIDYQIWLTEFVSGIRPTTRPTIKP